MSSAVCPDAGIGQDRGRGASPEELWRDYPLTQDDKAGAEAGRAPAAEGTRDAPPGRVDEGADDEGGSRMVVVGLLVLPLLVLLAVSAAFNRRRRRTGSASPDGPTTAPPGQTWAALRSSAWTAQIQWHSEDGASCFRVVASPPSGQDGVSLLESRRLDWPPRSDAAVESLVAAVADLERSVVAAGWEVADPGASWFARRFVWPRSDRAPERALETAQARGA